MPFVHIANAGPLSADQRRKIASEVTELLHQVTGKPHASVYCRIDSVPRDEFAVGGQLLADRDAERAEA
ncbi:MAG: 4-oxalocrotonate tautomerase family protein [Planctomycetes bacterium]|nr:4-oxalocrotonate tautomerase family protein [Planctomycetota bacterium]